MIINVLELGAFASVVVGVPAEAAGLSMELIWSEVIKKSTTCLYLSKHPTQWDF